MVAVGADAHSAVGGRIDAFARGLTRLGWAVTVIDPPLPTYPVDRLLTHTPAVLRSVLENAGVEGDLRLGVGWQARHALRGVAADVAVVSVPPFSLLGAAATTLDPRVPLVVDYRDPWSARRHPRYSPERPGRSSDTRCGGPPRSPMRVGPRSATCSSSTCGSRRTA
ncbi:MAG: hypothetical protein ACRDRS_01675 [Pseudonocardiaceae bacterium]